MADTHYLAGRLARSSAPRAMAFALMAALAPHVAHAEEADGATIIVTGHGLEQTPGTPAYSTVELDRTQITASASGRAEDVLSSVAGFQQFRRSDSRSSNPSAQGVTLRALGGNATSRALVLLDGVPMADPFFGYVPYPALVPETLSRIRVTRGGGSGPFGLGSLSGTIELESAGPDELGLISADALVDQRGETQVSGSVAPRLGGGFAVITGRWDRGEGFWTTPKDQRVAASVRARYESWSTGARIVAPLTSDIELQSRLLVFRDDRTLRFAGADSASEGEDASIRLVGRGDWQFDALGYVQVRNFSNVVISSSNFLKSLDQYKTPSSGLGGKFELRPPVGEGRSLRLGVDWRRASGTMKERAYFTGGPNVGKVREQHEAGGVNSDVGFYADGDVTVGPLVLTGGLRADRTRQAGGYYQVLDPAGTVTSRTDFAAQSDWTVTWRGGALVHLGSIAALRVAAYTGLRQPTLNELYRPFTVFPVVTRANAALTPEKLRGFEAGIDLTPMEGVQITATAFDNRIRDAIANVTIGTNLRERQNVDRLRSRGIELGAHAATGPLRFDGSLTWTDAEVRNGAASPLTGMLPSQTPKFAASGTLGVVPAKGWEVAATLRHVGKQYEDDLQTDVLPAATTLDMVARVPLVAGASLTLRAENLFNEEIVTRNSGGTIDLGTPRTLWAGLHFTM
ncbi:TonB-dependent receptor [Novosphingobium colocasiae]|uniref:TonB-dependent receptor n=1 Tax=Novosphingobium colocasiae TaxID=1256513 RepID=UPI0035B46676